MKRIESFCHNINICYRNIYYLLEWYFPFTLGLILYDHDTITHFTIRLWTEHPIIFKEKIGIMVAILQEYFFLFVKNNKRPKDIDLCLEQKL